MRLFVALDLPEEVRTRLEDLIVRLRPSTKAARWVQAAGLHLTLKFIGEVPESRRPAIVEALRGLSSSAPVELTLHQLGYFPTERHPRVLWVGVRASENLLPLVAEMEAALEPLGVARERRPYVPHLTLARFRAPENLSRLQGMIRELGEIEFGHADAREFQLYQSRLSPRGAEYTILERFPFVQKA